MADQTELEIAKRQLTHQWDQESATTLKLLRAYPSDQSELQPHPRAKTARDLAWMFTLEMKLVGNALRGTLDLSRAFTPAPATLAEVVSTFESTREELLTILRDATPAQLAGTVKFFIAPKTMGDMPLVEFSWFILHDQIHHRGQFSIYLRMAGGKVPSIYGPTADEPWF
jgi:uncharacterized damage-inducible protein DinB